MTRKGPWYNPDRREPTAEQLAALQTFAKTYGRYWKRELRDQWMSGRNWKEPGGNHLQVLRNQFGPTWLDNFKLPKEGGEDAAIVL